MTYTDQDLVHKLLTQEKWEKTQAMLDWVYHHIEAGMPMIRSQFWSKTGFLLHVVETYDVCEPHLQGFFLLENAW